MKADRRWYEVHIVNKGDISVVADMCTLAAATALLKANAAWAAPGSTLTLWEVVEEETIETRILCGQKSK